MSATEIDGKSSVVSDYESIDPQKNVFMLVEMDDEDVIEWIGTAVAISSTHVLTTWSNGMVRCRVPHCRLTAWGGEVYVRERNVFLVISQLPVTALTYQTSDLLEVNMEKCDEEEDWCVLKRDSDTGEFTSFCAVCPELELPQVHDEVTMYDSLLACNTSNGAQTITQVTRIAWYYCRDGRKRKLVSDETASDESLAARYEMVNVVSDGSDIYNSDCSPLIDRNGKLFALYAAYFHYKSSKDSARHARVLSRSHSFKEWYNDTFPALII